MSNFIIRTDFVASEQQKTQTCLRIRTVRSTPWLIALCNVRYIQLLHLRF